MVTAKQWEHRRARWAAYRAAVDASKAHAAARLEREGQEAYREHVEDRGRDFVEDTKHTHD